MRTRVGLRVSQVVRISYVPLGHCSLCKGNLGCQLDQAAHEAGVEAPEDALRDEKGLNLISHIFEFQVVRYGFKTFLLGTRETITAESPNAGADNGGKVGELGDAEAKRSDAYERPQECRGDKA